MTGALQSSPFWIRNNDARIKKTIVDNYGNTIVENHAARERAATSNYII